ncbi:MAG: hypothetical protein QW797_02785 [Thermoproteota archaeon]
MVKWSLKPSGVMHSVNPWLNTGFPSTYASSSRWLRQYGFEASARGARLILAAFNV